MFPYLGYYQLIVACDVFISLDNVQYIERGWVNRNRILVQGRADYFTIPVKKSSRHFWINRRFVFEDERVLKKIERKLEYSYLKAPYYNEVSTIVRDVLYGGENNIARMAESSLKSIMSYLGIERTFLCASDLITDKDAVQLGGADKLIALAKKVGADTYINPIGGLELYSKDLFSAKGVSLFFCKPCLPAYDQGIEEFIPGLSIIDVLMFNSVDKVLKMMTCYELI